MSRFILILLLAILPLQMSWGAVTSYCEHEQGKAAQHFGHHVHKHTASPADKQTKSAKFKADTDCGYCHHAHQKVASTSAFTLAPAARTVPPPVLSLSYQSYIPEGLLRPNWVTAS